MGLHFKNDHSKQELHDAILGDKAKGMEDVKIGRKYGISFRYLERLITKREGVSVSRLGVTKKIKTLFPKDFAESRTTVWSFKRRGDWATHSGEYRGNWSPYIPRNVIIKYSKPGETVLDYFCGAGTTAVEAKLLGRKCIAFDINDAAIELAKKNIDFKIEESQLTLFAGRQKIHEPELCVGDARDLSFLKANSIDLICAHPPYANIIQYTHSKEGDLSFLDIDDFLEEIAKVAEQSLRVLKPGRQCAILIGDTRRKKNVIPLGFKLINVYLNAGFKLRELVIKRQHNCKTTGFWYANSIKYNFLLLAHEYLPIFEKPQKTELTTIKEGEVLYGAVLPSIKKPLIKKKLDEFETTTVWVLPEKDFERRLNKNVIDRYSNGRIYKTISFNSYEEKEGLAVSTGNGRSKGLLFLKSPFLNGYLSLLEIESYLDGIKGIVNDQIQTMHKGGFVVIQTKDVRLNGYTEPLAKRIVDKVAIDGLSLKEIVIVTREGVNSQLQNENKYLEVNHQYLLVYEVVKC